LCCTPAVSVGSCAQLPLFFSSRRRHTRSKRDWSSDVCSSDLGTTTSTLSSAINQNAFFLSDIPYLFFMFSGRKDSANRKQMQIRSEERRVGKEGRARGGRC